MKNQIKLNTIKQENVSVYNPNGEFLGFANYEELLDIQLQIVKERAEGYYIIHNGKKSAIDNIGQVHNYPDVFNVAGRIFAEIIKVRQSIKK